MRVTFKMYKIKFNWKIYRFVYCLAYYKNIHIIKHSSELDLLKLKITILKAYMCSTNCWSMLKLRWCLNHLSKLGLDSQKIIIVGVPSSMQQTILPQLQSNNYSQPQWKFKECKFYIILFYHIPSTIISQFRLFGSKYLYN